MNAYFHVEGVQECLTLIQLDNDDQEFMVTYVDRCNNKIETKHSSYKRECFTIVWVVSSFE